MHPILFKIPLPHWNLPKFLGGGELHAFPIYAYGVMLGLSLVVGWYISLTLAKQDGLPRETMANNYVFTAICAIIGSRVLYILTNLEEFHGWRDYLAIRSGGLVAYGGFLGGFLGSWYFCARRKIRLLAWADAAVPSLASGLLFTRIGCFLFGCDFGKKLSDTTIACAEATSDAPVAGCGGVKHFFLHLLEKAGTFPEWHYDHKLATWLKPGSDEYVAAVRDHKDQILSGSPAWAQHFGDPTTQSTVRELHHSIPVHPTQIYESVAGLFLLAVLFLARRNIKKRQAAGTPFFRGELFVVFTFGYGVLRFLIEIVRDDAERKTYGPYFEPHIIYPVVLMAFALAFVVGLAGMVPEKGYRRVIAQSLAILVPLLAFLILKPPPYSTEIIERVQLSTSQWLGLVTGIAASLYYRRGIDVAVLDPVASADLGEGVPALVAAEEAAERGEVYDPNAETDDDVPAAEEGAPKKVVANRNVDDEDAPRAKPRKEMKTVRDIPRAKKTTLDDADEPSAGTEGAETAETDAEIAETKADEAEAKVEAAKAEAKAAEKAEKKAEAKVEAAKVEAKAEAKADDDKKKKVPDGEPEASA